MNKEQRIENFYNDVRHELQMNACNLYSIGTKESFCTCFMINEFDQFEVFLYECGNKQMYKRYYNIETAALNFAVRVTKNYHTAMIVRNIIISNYKKYFDIDRINLNELYDMISENNCDDCDDYYKITKKIISQMINELKEELDCVSAESFIIDLKHMDLVEQYLELLNKLKERLNKKCNITEISNLSLLAYNCFLEDKKNYLNDREEYLEKEEISTIASVNYESVYRYVRKKLSK